MYYRLPNLVFMCVICEQKLLLLSLLLNIIETELTVERYTSVTICHLHFTYSTWYILYIFEIIDRRPCSVNAGGEAV